MKPLEISETDDELDSDSDEVHLVSDEFGRAEELGFRQCDLPIVRKLSAPTKLSVQFSARCCAACQLSSGSLS